MEFIPVKEKVKLIAAQQEELEKKEESKRTETSDNPKQRGVRILPPSPVTVRKMSVEEELHSFDSEVTRTTPTTGFMETPPPRPQLPDLPMYQEVRQSKEQSTMESTEADYSTIDSGISHSVASSSQQMSSTMQSSNQHSSMKTSQKMSSKQEQSSSQQISSFSEQKSCEQTFSSTSSQSIEKTSRSEIPGWNNSSAMTIDEHKEKEELLQNMKS